MNQNPKTNSKNNEHAPGPRVLIIGAGLAGAEAAYFLAERGIEVILLESKRKNPNPAQTLSDYAELVCSNSLKSTLPETPHGLLKWEMQEMGSLILKTAMDQAIRVPAGDALAVNRQLFAAYITDQLRSHPLIKIFDEEVSNPLESAANYECQYTIIASGPLTTMPLESWIKGNVSNDDFYFYDAIAPIIDANSIDHSKLYWFDRYKPTATNTNHPNNTDDTEKPNNNTNINTSNRSSIADYLNIPLAKDEYFQLVSNLLSAEKIPARNFEKFHFFEGCLPVDVLAERGPQTLRCSCLKPNGLPRPDGSLPYAVIQLRKENLLGDAYNMVGFQTRLTYPEQARIFRTLPGLQHADFVRFGQVHRNSFLSASKVLNIDMSSKKINNLYFAGQITGVEGYTESAMSGIYVAYQLYQRIKELPILPWPTTTATGALINYILTSSNSATAHRPTPSNVNMGLFPPLADGVLTKIKSVVRAKKSANSNSAYPTEYTDKKREKRRLIALRAQESWNNFFDQRIL